MGHYFALFGWPVSALQARRTLLLVKSVKINNPLNPKVKGVLSVKMLKALMSVMATMEDFVVYKAICLFEFIGLFRLASLFAATQKSYDTSSYPLVKDIIFTNKGLQFILKSAKICRSLLS